jgi:hypothetical protein
MSPNAENVLRWTLWGAGIAFLAGFAASASSLNDAFWPWLNLHLFFGIVAGVFGGAVGAFAEVFVHARRRR